MKNTQHANTHTNQWNEKALIKIVIQSIVRALEAARYKQLFVWPLLLPHHIGSHAASSEKKQYNYSRDIRTDIHRSTDQSFRLFQVGIRSN